MPSIAVTRKYEAIYIVDPDSGEEKVTAVSTKYRELVEKNGGSVEKIDVWERRKLAYQIKGRTEGIYIIMQFSGVPTVESELRRVFQISEDHIRYMIIKPEEMDDTLGQDDRYGRNDRADRGESSPAPAAPAETAAAPAAADEAAPVAAVAEEAAAEPVAEVEAPVVEAVAATEAPEAEPVAAAE